METLQQTMDLWSKIHSKSFEKSVSSHVFMWVDDTMTLRGKVVEYQGVKLANGISQKMV